MAQVETTSDDHSVHDPAASPKFILAPFDTTKDSLRTGRPKMIAGTKTQLTKVRRKFANICC